MSVTLALICYNQERFVRDAVRSVLAQDYQPLEIVISDDCSTDGTYDIIEEEVARYDGPHTVRKFRNRRNLGPENWAETNERARGEFVVIAHGDDIAVPQRTRRLVETWAETAASLVTSNAEIIDAEAKEMGLLIQNGDSGWISAEEIAEKGWQRRYLGATMAWQKNVFSEFKALDGSRMPAGIDHVLPFRASVLNGVYYLAEPLVKWRQHDSNEGKSIADMTQSHAIRKETLTAYDLNCRICMLDDLEDFVDRNDGRPELQSLRRLLASRVIDLSRDWSQRRNGLLMDGKRPTWVDKSEIEARQTEDDTHFKPAGRAKLPGVVRLASRLLRHLRAG